MLWYFSWPAVSQISSFRDAAPKSTTFVKNAPETQHGEPGLHPPLRLGEPWAQEAVGNTCSLPPTAGKATPLGVALPIPNQCHSGLHTGFGWEGKRPGP